MNPSSQNPNLEGGVSTNLTPLRKKGFRLTISIQKVKKQKWGEGESTKIWKEGIIRLRNNGAA